MLSRKVWRRGLRSCCLRERVSGVEFARSSFLALYMVLDLVCSDSRGNKASNLLVSIDCNSQ